MRKLLPTALVLLVSLTVCGCGSSNPLAALDHHFPVSYLTSPNGKQPKAPPRTSKLGQAGKRVRAPKVPKTPQAAQSVNFPQTNTSGGAAVQTATTQSQSRTTSECAGCDASF